MWSSREDSEEKSPPAEAPALGPAELKSTTNGDDARPAGLLHEPHELSTSTLTKLEAASDEVSGVQLGLHAMLNDYLGDYFKRHRDGVFNIGIGPGGYVCMLAIWAAAAGE